MKQIFILSIFIIILCFGKETLAGVACNGYEAVKINHWKPDFIQKTMRILVQVCCGIENEEFTEPAGTVRVLRLSLKHGDEIEIDNLEVDDKHPVTYTCRKDGDINNQCENFTSAYVNKKISDITVRAYHQDTRQFSGYIDKHIGSELYYGFKVNKGVVKITDYSNKVCEARVNGKSSKSRIRLNGE